MLQRLLPQHTQGTPQVFDKCNTFIVQYLRLFFF